MTMLQFGREVKLGRGDGRGAVVVTSISLLLLLQFQFRHLRLERLLPRPNQVLQCQRGTLSVLSRDEIAIHHDMDLISARTGVFRSFFSQLILHLLVGKLLEDLVPRDLCIRGTGHAMRLQCRFRQPLAWFTRAQ